MCPDETIKLEKLIDPESIIEAWGYQGLDVATELAGVTSLGLYRCCRSQLQFYYPAIVGTEKLYQFIARQSWYYSRSKWEFAAAAQLLHDHNCKSILEIGCGSGGFLESAAQHGILAHGIDLNSEAVQQARSFGLSATTESMGELLAKDRRYDAVLAFQVLEHIADPIAFIREALRLVAPHGYLLFCTPNGDGWLGDRLQLLDVPPHHVTRWGRAAFAFLPVLFPVRIVDMTTEPLQPQHYNAWAASLVDPDPMTHTGVVRCARKLSVKNRLLTMALRTARHFAISPGRDGQSLLTLYQRIEG